MTTASTSGARTYAVRVTFLSKGEPFATETFTHVVLDERDDILHEERLAQLLAGNLATMSVYSNALIPDLTCAVTITEVPPDDPDTPPPPPSAPPAAAAVMPRCRHCGSGVIYRDANAEWDEVAQAWSLSGTYDSHTCGICGAESNNLTLWVPTAPADSADAFLWDVVEDLQNASLARDAEFQLFCLNVHDTLTVEEAAAEWRSRTAD